MAKVGANYMNSQLIKLEALENGYAEGIALDINGYVSEGSGEIIFVVIGGKLYTRRPQAPLLPGITRHSVFQVAEPWHRGRAAPAPEEALYGDEIFMTGTAAEITPVTMVDKITIGTGVRGPITKRLQEKFFRITEGKTPMNSGGLRSCKGLRSCMGARVSSMR